MISKETVDLVKKFRDDRDWRQFHNPKGGDIVNDGLNRIVFQKFFHIRDQMISGFICRHIDEVDQDHAADAQKTKKSCNFPRGFGVDLFCGIGDVAAAAGHGRIDVNDRHGFAAVDHKRGAALHQEGSQLRAFELMIDIVQKEGFVCLTDGAG